MARHFSSPGRSTRSVFWIIAALFLMLRLAHAGPDEDYLSIYNVFSRADQLAEKGNTAKAHKDYIQALRELRAFQESNPRWNPQILDFRLNYLSQKIAETAEKPAPAETKSPESGATSAPASAKSSPQSPVKLLDAGSAPLKALRLHPTVGKTQSMVMTVKMAMDIASSGQHMPSMNLPAMQMTMQVVVKSIAPNGDINYDMTFQNVGITDDDTNANPTMISAMKSALNGIQGMTATGKMSNQGVIRAIHVNIPTGTSPLISQAMSQMKDSFSSSSTPFPTEPVGRGAKWEYSTKIKNQGMTMNQTITYELVSIADDQVTLHSTITQKAAHQQVHNPMMRGMKVDLTKLEGSGSGESTIDLNQILPIKAAINESTEMSMGMNMGQKKQEMNMKMDMKISIKGK